MSTQYLQPELDEISEEGDRARQKFGDQFSLVDLHWLAILAEEFGEVAKVVTQTSVPPQEDATDRSAELRAEIIQVAAVAARWVRAMDLR